MMEIANGRKGKQAEQKKMSKKEVNKKKKENVRSIFFFNKTATTEIYTEKIVGSVRSV